LRDLAEETKNMTRFALEATSVSVEMPRNLQECMPMWSMDEHNFEAVVAPFNETPAFWKKWLIMI